MAKRPNVKTKDSTILINVGCLFDIITGTFIIGKKGEVIINGGLDSSVGIVGPGNAFKSTILHYLTLSAFDTINMSKVESFINTQDTEINMKYERLNSLGRRFKYLKQYDPLINGDEGKWAISDKSTMFGDEWVSATKSWADDLAKEKKVTWTSLGVDTLVPVISQVDSITELTPKVTDDLLNKSTQEDSTTNMVFMKQGLFKTKFISEMPLIASKANMRFLMTAHLGKAVDMASSKYVVPTKDLQYLKEGEIIKGVSKKFLFLVSNVWTSERTSILKNQSTKLPEYPRKDEEQETDLNIVFLKAYRNKSGPSGIVLPIVVSQTEGVKPQITEYHYCKLNGRYGIAGSNTRPHMALLPNVSFTRPSLRMTLEDESDMRLNNAITYTSQLLQTSIHKPEVMDSGLYMEPEELYNKLTELGYDMNILLQGRIKATMDNYSKDLPPYLSFMCLLRMANEQYHPFWLEKDKVTVKPAWAKHINKDLK